MEDLIGFATHQERDLKQIQVCYNCYIMYGFIFKHYIRGDGLKKKIVPDEDAAEENPLHKLIDHYIKD